MTILTDFFSVLSVCFERRVLTLATSVDSGRAQASSYPGPHVRSRGPQLLPLLMFLTCSITRSEGGVGGHWPIASTFHHNFSSMSGSLRLKIPERENLLLLQQRKWRATSTQWLLDLTPVRSIANTPVANSLYKSVFDSRVNTYCLDLLAICVGGYVYLKCACMKFCLARTSVRKPHPPACSTVTQSAETKSCEGDLCQHVPLQ